MEDKIFRPSRNKLKDTLIKNKRKKSIFTTPVLLTTIILFFILFLLLGKGPDLSAQELDNYTSAKTDHTKITFTGDVSPTRFLKRIADQNGHGVFYNDVKKIWQDSDISIINLESVVVEDEQSVENYPELSDREGAILLDTTKADIKAISDSGINLVGFANNHSRDFGIKGMIDTMQAIDETGMNRVGVGYNQNEAILPHTQEINGINYTITAINDRSSKSVASGGNIPRIFSTSHIYTDYELQRIFNSGDFNIVYIHWGTEYSLHPDKEIQELGRKYIDMGADLVIGSHQHVILPVEKYNGGLIAYGMGNLVFDQMLGRTPDSAVGSLYVNNSERFLEFVPIKLEEGIPFIQDADLSVTKKVFSTLTRYLDDNEFSIEDGKLRIEF